MTLVLKSNKKATLPSLSDAVSVKPVIDLDFRNEKYTVEGVGKALTEVVTTKTPYSTNYNGRLERTQLSADTPNVTIDPMTFKKGLLNESRANNYFGESNKPKTRGLQIASAPVKQLGTVILVTVEGEGSLTLKRGPDKKALCTATEDSYGYYIISRDDLTINPNWNFDAEVEGSLTFASVSALPDSHTMPLTRVETPTSAPVGKSETINEIDPALLSQVLTGTQCTLVIKTNETYRIYEGTELELPDRNRNKTIPAAYIGDGLGKLGVFVSTLRDTDNDYARFRVTKSSGAEIFPATTLTHDSYDTPKSYTHVVRIDGNKASWSCNGSDVYTFETDANIPTTKIRLGDAFSYATGRINTLIEQAVVYNTALSDEQIIKLSSR